MMSKTQTQPGGREPQVPNEQQASEGTEASFGNLISFGLMAEDLLLPEENAEEFDQFADDLWDGLAPEGMEEANLAARIINLSWRLQRAGGYERYVVEAARDGKVEPKKKGPGRPRKAPELTDGEAIAYLLLQTHTYGTMSRYEAHLERCLHRNLAAFRQLQRERREREAEGRRANAAGSSPRQEPSRTQEGSRLGPAGAQTAAEVMQLLIRNG